MCYMKILLFRQYIFIINRQGITMKRHFTRSNIRRYIVSEVVHKEGFKYIYIYIYIYIYTS